MDKTEKGIATNASRTSNRKKHKPSGLLANNIEMPNSFHRFFPAKPARHNSSHIYLAYHKQQVNYECFGLNQLAVIRNGQVTIMVRLPARYTNRKSSRTYKSGCYTQVTLVDRRLLRQVLL